MAIDNIVSAIMSAHPSVCLVQAVTSEILHLETSFLANSYNFRLLTSDSSVKFIRSTSRSLQQKSSWVVRL